MHTSFTMSDITNILSSKEHLDTTGFTSVDIVKTDVTEHGPSMCYQAYCRHSSSPIEFTVCLHDECVGMYGLLVLDVSVPLVFYNDDTEDTWSTDLTDDTRRHVVTQLNCRNLRSVVRLVDDRPVSVSSMFYDLADYVISGKKVLEKNFISSLYRIVTDPEINMLDGLFNVCVDNSTSDKMYILKVGGVHD